MRNIISIHCYTFFFESEETYNSKDNAAITSIKKIYSVTFKEKL